MRSELTRGSLGWAAIVGAGLTLETWAIRSHSHNWPTLSTLIGRHTPKWALGVGLAALSVHLMSWKESK